MNKNPIQIFFIASGNYAPFVATTALSIIENTNEDINFHVLTENFEEEDKEKLSKFLKLGKFNVNVNIDFTDVSEHLKRFAGAQLCWFKSYITYARILIPELFPDIDKAFYMDIDIIVNCDIKELWDVDFSPLQNGDGQGERTYALAAAKGYKNGYAIKNLGISPEHRYFNAGLLVLNCKMWRENNLTAKLIHLATNTTARLQCADQDIFNIFFDNNNYVAFDRAYNFSPKYHYDTENFKIIHYCFDKPWENRDCTCSEYFWRIAEKTPYYQQLVTILETERGKSKNFTPLSQFASSTRLLLKNRKKQGS
jgi:lipopolysaccharide biosynthesis glycosyltransferase